MRIGFLDYFIAYLALLSGLTISAVAVWYSVAGLVTIFAASIIPVMIMGVALETGKLIATIWLKQNWQIAPKLVRLYLVIAVFILMLITSMGIFGFLSKAHLDQTITSGNITAQIESIDQKIQIQNDLITSARTVLRQMDEAVNQSLGRGAVNLPPNATPQQIQAAQTAAERNTNAAATLRRNQQRERDAQQAIINRAQDEIQRLRVERAPIATQQRAFEAEVGPIKYIAALIYGNDNPDNDLLERAVRWMIILIVIIFDPLAVVLLLASQSSFQHFRKIKYEQRAADKLVTDLAKTAVKNEPVKPTEDNEIQKPVDIKKEPTLSVPSPIVVAVAAPVVDAVQPAALQPVIEKQTVVDVIQPAVVEIVSEPNLHISETAETVITETKLAEPVAVETKPEEPVAVETKTAADIPPQGTADEFWSAPVGDNNLPVVTQPTGDLDKIYKEAAAAEAKNRRRNRGWLQSNFPKRDE